MTTIFNFPDIDIYLLKFLLRTTIFTLSLVSKTQNALVTNIIEEWRILEEIIRAYEKSSALHLKNMMWYPDCDYIIEKN